MAFVYILYSKKFSKHYIGSCQDLNERLERHQNKFFPDSFTTSADDWQLVFSVGNLEYVQARKIETHIKNMKSSKYVKNLIIYKEIIEKLIEKYK